MKTNLIALVFITVMTSTVMAAPQPKTWTFTYRPKADRAFPLTFTAESKAEAFKMASRECFRKLTKGEYPGDEKGLEYIDVCANPKM